MIGPLVARRLVVLAAENATFLREFLPLLLGFLGGSVSGGGGQALHSPISPFTPGKPRPPFIPVIIEF